MTDEQPPQPPPPPPGGQGPAPPPGWSQQPPPPQPPPQPPPGAAGYQGSGHIPPTAFTPTDPGAKKGMSGCLKALVIGLCILFVLGIGTVVALVVLVDRGTDTLSKNVVGESGEPESNPRGVDYPDSQKKDHVAGENGAVNIVGYTITARDWARTTDAVQNPVICSDVTIVDRSADEESFAVFNWQLRSPSGTINSLNAVASDLQAEQLQSGGSGSGKVCFDDPGGDGTFVAYWRPKALNASRAVWVFEL